uniref:Epidermal growth factor Smed-egf-6 n=1 Tax=Schmidtea mediterranea TaxID=79327 RepID=A0A1B1ACY1_SCHMD|nr:epidermal growth factor Smed-egf-6 [Schmidtea mediterranea]
MYSDVQLFKLTHAHLLKVFFLLLLVAIIVPQLNPKSGNINETIVAMIRNHYFDLMSKKNDWLMKILEVVKVELTFRQIVWRCGKNNSCLYSIQLFHPISESRNRRSIAEQIFKDNPIFEERILNSKPRYKQFKNIKVHKTTREYLPTKPIANRMTACEGRFLDYCQNGAKCLFIDMLKRAVCLCNKGYGGIRCEDFSLSDTVQYLGDYQMKTLDVYTLNQKNHEDICSVVDATARFTYNVISKDILQSKPLDN